MFKIGDIIKIKILGDKTLSWPRNNYEIIGIYPDNRLIIRTLNINDDGLINPVDPTLFELDLLKIRKQKLEKICLSQEIK